MNEKRSEELLPELKDKAKEVLNKFEELRGFL